MQDKRQQQKQPAKPISIGGEGELTDEQFAAIRKFVEQLGGIENARQAVAALKDLEKAA